jgi:phosphomannomutase
MADDPDPADRAEIRDLLDAGDGPALGERFAGPLSFGTAGIRGPMRAGPNGMNRATVRRTAAGLATFLAGTLPDRRAEVVVAFDGRHRSREFAADCAGILAGAGCRVSLVTDAVPTPLLAFAVRRHRADAGVMITASHNPAVDNGLKVYLGAPAGSAADGAQIVPPADLAIEQAIRAVPGVGGLAMAESKPVAASSLVEPYLDAVTRLVGTGRDPGDLRIAYTPLHGLGAGIMVAALTRAGFPAPDIVAEQAVPDPDFPTVPFPNPEEPGALDGLRALVARTGADLGIASDPDVDRCAVVVGGRTLTGDEIGWLLADAVLRHRRGPVATSLVSSRLLPAMAARAGIACTTTLTGFKWLVRADPGLVFAYEEALGYAVAPDVVRDKDGISAALQLAGLAAELRRDGRTLLDRLDDLAVEFGLHLTGAVSIRFARAQQATGRLEELRSVAPRRIGDHAVLRTTDLTQGSAALPPTDGLVWELDGGGRVVVRPSGTEPKLKAYLELVRPTASDVPATRAATARELTALADAVRRLLAGPDQPSN